MTLDSEASCLYFPSAAITGVPHLYLVYAVPEDDQTHDFINASQYSYQPQAQHLGFDHQK